VTTSSLGDAQTHNFKLELNLGTSDLAIRQLSFAGLDFGPYRERAVGNARE
jgi:hypothetical protein